MNSRADVHSEQGGQAKSPKYLHDGDIVEATVATDDGAIDLGAQRNVVTYA